MKASARMTSDPLAKRGGSKGQEKSGDGADVTQ